MQYHISPKSHNIKTGAIVVTTSSALTCPDACPFKGTKKKPGACYAKYSFLGLFWRKVTAGLFGNRFPEFIKALALALEKNPAPIWRHNQAGDLPGLNNKIDASKLEALAMVSAASGRQGFTYTHKPVLVSDVPASPSVARSNLKALRYAAALGFTVNLSANNVRHADALAATGLPICVTVPKETPETFFTPEGRKGIICPAQTRSDVSCLTCRLCSRANRSVLIGFRFHGTGAKIAQQAAALKGGNK